MYVVLNEAHKHMKDDIILVIVDAQSCVLCVLLKSGTSNWSDSVWIGVL